MSAPVIDRDEILRQLDIRRFYADHLRGFSPKGRREEVARCPFHDDGTPSLSINMEEGVFHCHGCGKSGSPFDFLSLLEGIGIAEAMRRITERYSITAPAGLERHDPQRIEAQYDYHDEDGRLLFQVVRFVPKGFRQRRPDGEGGWIWDTKGLRRVLYNLPLVIDVAHDGGTVYIVEGEKDADALNAWDGCDGQLLAATTNPGGAGKWRDEYGAFLTGAHVVIVADRDAVGRTHARKVYGNVRAFARSARIVEAAVGKDLSDHLDAGLGLAELVDLAAEPVVAAHEPEIASSWLPVLTATDIFTEPLAAPRYVLPGIETGDSALIVAASNVGKTLFAISCAVCAAAGVPLLDRFPLPEALRVLLVLQEDSRARTIRRVKQLMRGHGITPADVGDRLAVVAKTGLFLGNRDDRVRLDAVAEAFRPNLVIFDSINQLSGITKLADAAEVRAFFRDHVDPFRLQHRCSTWWIHHTSKQAWSKMPMTEPEGMVLGSADFMGAVDSLTLLQRHKQITNRRVVSVLKFKDGDRPSPYEIEIVSDRWCSAEESEMPLSLRYCGELNHDQARAALKPASKADAVRDLIRKHPGRRFSVQELARSTGLERSTVQKAVSDDPALRSVPDPDDARRRLYYLPELNAADV